MSKMGEEYNRRLERYAPELLAVCKKLDSTLWLQIATMSNCKVKDELVSDRQELLRVIAKIERIER